MDMEILESIRRLNKQLNEETNTYEQTIEKSDNNYVKLVDTISTQTSGVIDVFSFIVNKSNNSVKVNFSVNNNKYIYLYSEGTSGVYVDTNQPFVLTKEIIKIFEQIYRVYESVFMEVTSELLKR